MDANGDGIGDFEGLMRCLDYLSNPDVRTEIKRIMGFWLELGQKRV